MNKAQITRRQVGSRLQQMLARCFPTLMLTAAVIVSAAGAQAANQYWDTSSDAGWQHGNGSWSIADTYWSTLAGTAGPSVWTNNNTAFFSGSNGISLISLKTSVATAGLVFNNSGYTVAISDGGVLSNTTADVMVSGTNNRIELTGSATWRNTAVLRIGQTNGYNAFVVNGSGVLATNAGLHVGLFSTSQGNLLMVTNGGQLISGSTYASIGYQSSSNLAEVTGGGALWNLKNANLWVGYNPGSTGNLLRIDGQGVAGGARVTNVAAFLVGNSSEGGQNELVITNGGQLYATSVTIGEISPSNQATLTGTGTLMRLSGLLYVGNSTTADKGNNGLTIDNGAVVTNVTDLQVGRSPGGSQSRMVITNGGALFCSGASYVGNTSVSNSVEITGGGALWDLGNKTLIVGHAAGSTGNVVRIDGQGVAGGARVTNVAALTVGNTLSGGKNELVIFNGGQFYGTSAATIGASSTSNRVAITGTGTLMRLGGALSVGSLTATGNVLTIESGAVVTNAVGVSVGASAGAFLSRMVITNGSTLSSSGAASYIGSASSSNSIEVTGAASIWNLGNQTLFIGHAAGSTGNVLRIDGQGVAGGARVTNVAALTVGNLSSGGQNELVITNGGQFYGTSSAAIGASSTSNRVAITGTGTLMRLGGALSVGSLTATGNVLSIDSGAVLTNAVGVSVGAGAGGFLNRMVITNGSTLSSAGAVSYIGNASSSNSIEVTGAASSWDLGNANLFVGSGAGAIGNTLTIDQGSTVANIATLAVNPTNNLVFFGGMLSVSNLTCNNGSVLNIGDGTQAAELVMQGGTHTNNTGFLIQSNATVSGRGRLAGGNSGVTFAAGSILRPGAPESASTTMATLQLGSSTWEGGSTLEINITNVTGAAGTDWDSLQILGSMNFATNSGKLKIKLDSLGETAGGFDPDVSRSVPLITYSAAAIAATDIELDTTNFLIGGNWVVSVTAWGIQLNYQRPVPSIYVSPTGNDTGGTNWTTAFTTLTNALTYVQDYDTIYVAGRTFSITSQVVFSGRTGVSIIGGYEAANDAGLPGPCDPAIWPTVVQRTSGYTRVMYVSGLTNSLIKNLTFRDGDLRTGNTDGPGLYLTACRDLTVDSCVFTNNYCVNASSTQRGAGVFINSGVYTLTHCLITKNIAAGSGNSYGHGGGLYMLSGYLTLISSQVTRNTALGGSNTGLGTDGGGIYVAAAATNVLIQSIVDYNQSGHYGGGIYSSGNLALQNSLVIQNKSLSVAGDGLYQASGTVSVQNCTVADNLGVGIQYAFGTISITNSIIWGHADDLKGFPGDPGLLSDVWFSCISNGDNLGEQGCIQLDPLFVDTNYYHLQSGEGYYAGGYFSGGSWMTGTSNSPVIDYGDPASNFANEPAPNGDRINMGAYGNTEVASKTESIIPSPASVTNLGADVWGHRTVRLNGQLMDGGGVTPECGFLYWVDGDSVTSSVSAGLQTDVYEKDAVGLTPGKNYRFVTYATNAAGRVLSDEMSFSTPPLATSLYVATSGNNTAGTNWTTAYTDLQQALDILESGDVLHLAGQTFARAPDFQRSSLWTWSGVGDVSIIGGYEAASDAVLPGTNDPVQWPTVISRVSGNARIFYLSDLTNTTLRNLTITGGSSSSALSGLGVYATRCVDLTFDACNLVTNKATAAGGWNGAGAYLTDSTIVFTNSLIAANSIKCANNSTTKAGGLFLNSGTTTFVRCSIIDNAASGNNNLGYAGGIAVESTATAIFRESLLERNTINQTGGAIRNAGKLFMENCLVTGNDSGLNAGDGIYLAAGQAWIKNCTVADNLGVGIQYAAGTISITNSIVWGHADDLKNFPGDPGLLPDVWFSCISNGDNAGDQFCIQLDPLFVDTNYYHLQSKEGYYAGGYFSGGSWTTGTSNSPAIDAGDSDSDFANEPEPNGEQINMGAYGNTEVASKTEDIDVTPAVVENLGATLWGHRTVRLQGQLLDGGGVTPECGFLYWIDGDSVTSSVSAGPQTDVYLKDASGLAPGTDYRFVAYATNAAGQSLSAEMGFSTPPLAINLYVATNGNNTAGTNWTTAYTDLQQALDILEAGDVLHLAGQIYSLEPIFQQKSLWSWSGVSDVSIIGGYEAANDAVLPGPNDPAQWPTTLQRISGTSRVLYLADLTNTTLRNLTITGGYSSDNMNGLGVYATRCVDLTFDACDIVSNKTTSAGTWQGAGAYLTGSTITFTHCLIASNSIQCANNSSTYAGGLFLNSGTTTFVRCSIIDNASSGNYGGYAGGIAVESTATAIFRESVLDGNASYQNSQGGAIRNAGKLFMQNCLVTGNNSTPNNGDGIYLAAGQAWLMNCTVADNLGVGIQYVAGTISITNSIIWGNSPSDLAGFPDDGEGRPLNVAYSLLGGFPAVDGTNGCLVADPLFDDPVYYHLQSRKGVYRGGYFSGGTGWANAAASSPGLDAGTNLPSIVWQNEPLPNGKIVNMGAYGGTSVASISTAPVGTVFMLR